MSDIPEPAKALSRFIKVATIVGVIGAIAYTSYHFLTPDKEGACPSGQEMARNNPPGKTPRFVCKPVSEETNAEY